MKILLSTPPFNRKRRRGPSPFGAPALYDIDALTQQTRILADGGTVTNMAFLSSLITNLKAGSGNCYTLFDFLAIAIAIKKDGANKASTIYDVSPSKAGVFYDCVQNTAALQQLWQDSQIDGKPWIMFDPAAGGYASANIATIAQPYTIFIVNRKDGGTAAQRHLIDIGSATVQGPHFRYGGNTTLVVAGADATFSVASAQDTLGQFTILINAASSTIRRKGVQIVTGNSGTAVGAPPFIALGRNRLAGNIHSGPIAFVGVVRRAVTDAQRDYIEGLLNNLYYPSTVA